MEEEPTDPHEQQLLAVFKSCLVEGETKLDKKGLLALCSKLELEQNHKDAIIELLEIDLDQKSISFYEFRDGFLALLDKSQKGLVNGMDKEVTIESQPLCNSNSGTHERYSHQSVDRTTAEATNCQTEKIFDHQKLQETWSNQNFLTIEDVNSFCNRGSTLSKQAIELIFEKLDMDCDGLINFNEFSHFLQSANNKFQENSNLNKYTYLQRDQTKAGCKGLIYDQTGNVSRSALIELLEVAGVSEVNSLLLALGFESSSVNIVDLSNALSSELKLHRDSFMAGEGEYMRLLRGAYILYQEQVRNLHLTMEHVCCERDKLRTDIIEANERANVLAQEIDDHHTRLEKTRQEQVRQLEMKHSEALKDLTSQLHLEREKSTNTLKSLEEQLQTSQQEEQRIRNELTTVLQELKLLEKENQNQSEEITKLEATNNQLSLQLRELAAAQEQVESIETRENEQVADLMAHIKRLQAEMKVLRDHNDELTSELEMLKHRDNDAKSIISSVDVRSTISDENDGLVSMPTTEVSDTEDEDKHQQSKYSDYSKANRASSGTRNKVALNDNSNGNSINKLTEIIQEFRNFLTRGKFCAECSALRNEVSSLISELELYQSSVPSASISTVSIKKRRPQKNLANELEAESKSSERTSQSCRDLVVSKSERFKNSKRISSSDDALHDEFDENLDHIDIKTVIRNKLSGLRDYPPRKETESNKTRLINNIELKKQNLENKDLLKAEQLRHATERKQLIDRCSELEKSLEMLKAEYEQCEDYWASKLDEERQIFEQEQKISDEKFQELFEKMAEYEEQYNIGDKSRADGRLSPIEERVNLEQQYNDLEEEFEKWRIEAQEELTKKEKEVNELREKLDNVKTPAQIDMSVQFPDEDFKNAYPALYKQICSASKSSDKVDSPVPTEQKSNLVQQCLQCHKSIIHNHCDCHVNSPQHYQQHTQKDHQKVKKNEGKSKHYHQKKKDMDPEINQLLKQREKLKQEIMRLQNMKTMSVTNMYPIIGTEEQNILSNLYANLYAQEQKQKYLQMLLQNQKRDHDRVMRGVWQQHLKETSNLKEIIKTLQDKLKRQLKLNKEQSEKLTNADFLTQELYVENAELTKRIKRQDEYCQILSRTHVEASST